MRKVLQRKTILATAISWMRPAGRRDPRAAMPPVPVAETLPQVVADRTKDREFTSYSLIGW